MNQRVSNSYDPTKHDDYVYDINDGANLDDLSYLDVLNDQLTTTNDSTWYEPDVDYWGESDDDIDDIENDSQIDNWHESLFDDDEDDIAEHPPF